jgi:hypothetical protein
LLRSHRVHPFAYRTSKAALWALTRELAADLAPMGIRVDAVCPGEINTVILPSGAGQPVSRIPLRRLGSPTEVAAVIFYLCSAQTSYVTGAEMRVNGTRTCIERPRGRTRVVDSRLTYPDRATLAGRHNGMARSQLACYLVGHRTRGRKR